MKTAISVPDKTFESAESLAKRLKVSRSELYVRALEHYLKLHNDDALTENFNKVHENIDSRIDPAMRSAARKILVATEKMSALVTEEYLGKRANRGKRKAFEAVLKKVPSVKPDERDKV